MVVGVGGGGVAADVGLQRVVTVADAGRPWLQRHTALLASQSAETVRTQESEVRSMESGLPAVCVTVVRLDQLSTTAPTSS